MVVAHAGHEENGGTGRTTEQTPGNLTGDHQEQQGTHRRKLTFPDNMHRSTPVTRDDTLHSIQ